MQNEYDIKILYGIAYRKGFKRYYIEKFLPSLREEYVIDEKDLPLTPPEATSFKFPRISRFPEAKNFDLMLKGYDQELAHLISKGWRPDLIHTHSTVNAGIIGAFLSQRHSIPLIITEHQTFLLHNYTGFVRKMIFDALEFADKVLAVSYHQMRCILMHAIKCEPIVVGNYINENLFSLKKKRETTTFKILTVTYPSYIKDNETFFKALALVIKKGHIDISITIIGNNSFYDLQDSNVDYYREMAQKYGLSDYCSLISYVERANLPAYYQDHDVFVSTSIAETFGVAVCEALASGLPVVSTFSGGVDDTVDNSNGIRVHIKDEKSLADAIIKIKTKDIEFDPAKVRNSVVNKFGSTAFKSRLKNLYEEVINLKKDK